MPTGATSPMKISGSVRLGVGSKADSLDMTHLGEDAAKHRTQGIAARGIRPKRAEVSQVTDTIAYAPSLGTYRRARGIVVSYGAKTGGGNPGGEAMKKYALAIVVLLAWPALAQQRVPELRFTSVPNYPTLPDGMNFGEVP